MIKYSVAMIATIVKYVVQDVIKYNATIDHIIKYKAAIVIDMGINHMITYSIAIE